MEKIIKGLIVKNGQENRRETINKFIQLKDMGISFEEAIEEIEEFHLAASELENKK